MGIALGDGNYYYLSLSRSPVAKVMVCFVHFSCIACRDDARASWVHVRKSRAGQTSKSQVSDPNAAFAYSCENDAYDW